MTRNDLIADEVSPRKYKNETDLRRRSTSSVFTDKLWRAMVKTILDCGQLEETIQSLKRTLSLMVL